MIRRQSSVSVSKVVFARAFEPRFCTTADLVVFASVVSKSLKTHAEEFVQECILLCQRLDGAACRLIYLDSYGVIAAEDEMLHLRKL